MEGPAWSQTFILVGCDPADKLIWCLSACGNMYKLINLEGVRNSQNGYGGAPKKQRWGPGWNPPIHPMVIDITVVPLVYFQEHLYCNAPITPPHTRLNSPSNRVSILLVQIE